MVKIRGGIVLVAVLFLIAAFYACERNITNVEEVTESGGVIQADNCFVCHSDSDTKLTAAEGQWNNSKHASGENTDRNTTPCTRCHTSEGFVQLANTGTIPSEVENPTSIHCFTCHAPHTNGNFALRVTAVQELQNGDSYDLGDANTCVVCHQARYGVDTYISDNEELSEHWGPHHSNQGDMLIGTNGYEFDGYDYDIKTNHRGATENGCLDCHFDVRASYFLGGHSFNMAYGEGAEERFNTGACAQCHSDMEEADDFNRAYAGGGGIQDSVTTLANNLRTILLNAGLIEYSAVEDSYHPIEDLVTSADSAGAVWNWLFIEEDRSEGVHNPKYAIDLLTSAIQFMQSSPSPTAKADLAARRGEIDGD